MKQTHINDPVYGFITIPSELIYNIIAHPFFQRLRHIRQLGLAGFVYPAATHSRFQHALGAMHLMGKALDTLRAKGIEITDMEFEAAQLAVLLHDIGHGPFSHASEDSIIQGIKHESLSYLFMENLNAAFNGALDLTLKIFRNSYKRKFFHQLVSSQLDIDRLDYLKRDCFFTGVQEGNIGVERIISMLNVYRENLVVEEKGILNIENFLNARRFMYWQVYLHKTSVSSERMLVNLLRRARALVHAGEEVQASAPLLHFLRHDITISHFKENGELLQAYGRLDDHDIWGAMKFWSTSEDPILATLATMILERNLFQIQLSNELIRKNTVEEIRQAIAAQYGTLRAETSYLFSHGTVSNEAYTEGQQINILMRSGELLDMAQASDLPNIKAISKIVKKNYLCWPKNVSL
ncbi:MAG TPA: HD domain-containing protein [Ohtaekwangia sp.]